jgi:hypothetical protein
VKPEKNEIEEAQTAALDIAAVVRLTEMGKARRAIASELRRTGRWVWIVQFILGLASNSPTNVNRSNSANAMKLV